MKNNQHFIITILSKIPNKELPDELLINNLSLFKQNILKLFPNYQQELTAHNQMNSLITNAINTSTNPNISEFLNIIYTKYLLSINNHITNKEYDKALTRYNKMLELLIVNFDLSKEYSDIKYNQTNPKNKLRVKIHTHLTKR